jgi:hypothetical protein
MAKLVLTMTMSLDGLFSGPNGELDWMTQAPDPEFGRDNVAFFDHIDRGFIGYPTASGMLPYWMNVASDPQAPADQRTLAEALNKLRPFLHLRPGGSRPVAERGAACRPRRRAAGRRGAQGEGKARKRPRCPRRHPHRPGLRPPRARRRIRPHRASHRARQRQARIHWQDRPGANGRQDVPVRSDARMLPAKPRTAAGPRNATTLRLILVTSPGDKRKTAGQPRSTCHVA